MHSDGFVMKKKLKKKINYMIKTTKQICNRMSIFSSNHYQVKYLTTISCITYIFWVLLGAALKGNYIIK